MNLIHRLTTIAAALVLLFTYSLSAENAADYDTTFMPPDGYGFRVMPAEQGVEDVVVDAQNRLLVVGEDDAVDGSFYRAYIVRLNADGGFDTSFGSGGFFAIPQMNRRFPDSSSIDVALASDSKIYVSFPIYTEASDNFGLVRVLADGSGLDPAFGTNGLAIATFDVIASGTDVPYDLVVQPDGKIVVVGKVLVSGGMEMDTDFGIARFTTDGVLDTTFNLDGKAQAAFDLGGDNHDRALAATMMGADIVIIGEAETASGFDVACRVLGDDGYPDMSFAGNGQASFEYSNQGVYASHSRAYAVTFAYTPYCAGCRTGLYIGGVTVDPTVVGATEDMAVLCLNTDGTQCSGFGNGGWVLVDFSDNTFGGIGDTDDELDGIFYDWQSDTLSLVGSANNGGTTRNAVARLDAGSGALDSSFGSGGTRYFDEGEHGAGDRVGGDIDGIGRIVLGVNVYNYANTTSDIWACRLQAPAAIFRDGFESGDTTAWTHQSP